MASNTENLGLYKKDPIADAQDTFNIKTMMNDNWDLIDQFAGDTKADIDKKAKIATGSYVGSSSSTKTISLPFEPKLVVVQSEMIKNSGGFDAGTDICFFNGSPYGMFLSSRTISGAQRYHPVFTWVNFSVSSSSITMTGGTGNSVSADMSAMNETGKTYHYVAVG